MEIHLTTHEQEWEAFLQSQPWTPFLQSFPMGEVYRKIGAEPIRLAVVDESGGAGARIVGICQAIVVSAKRGKHLAVSYGPVLEAGSGKQEAVRMIVEELKKIAKEKGCSFIRMSPFWVRSLLSSSAPNGVRGVERPLHSVSASTSSASTSVEESDLQSLGFRPSPLHLLAEHIWYLNLRGKSEEDIRKGMRSTTRNLIGRAEREGVTIELSPDPVRDLPHFLVLHDETRKRHGFTPYTNDFFRAQVEVFAKKNQCALYLARYNGEVVSSSIHMVYGGETSYHHGASTFKYSKIPASYLLQWRAIQDALKRGDRVYNFWGVAPVKMDNGKWIMDNATKKHPFSGVTTFKTGFGGELLELQHCMDLPLSKKYVLTWGIETFRKWRRGF